MKRFHKIYLEISNRCNLSCAFCPGTKRKPNAMDEDAFAFLIQKLKPWTDYLYFHLMGEPLCHPKLEQFLNLAAEAGFRVIITTNGTLLPQFQNILLNAPGLHKVNISLHAFEANDLKTPFSDYLNGCFRFGQSAQGKKLVCYRLWNQGGMDQRNAQILQALEAFFPLPWIEEPRGTRIGNRVYLEHAEKFDWPDLSAEDRNCKCFCYGLRDQIGVLCDGTVVPCCLDHDGDVPLGNLFAQEMEEILASPRAQAIFHGFQRGIAVKPLCRKCGYGTRFSK